MKSKHQVYQTLKQPLGGSKSGHAANSQIELEYNVVFCRSRQGAARDVSFSQSYLNCSVSLQDQETVLAVEAEILIICNDTFNLVISATVTCEIVHA